VLDGDDNVAVALQTLPGGPQRGALGRLVLLGLALGKAASVSENKRRQRA